MSARSRLGGLKIVVLAISALCAAYQISTNLPGANRPNLRIFSVCQSASRNGFILAQILAHRRDGLQVRVTLGVRSPSVAHVIWLLIMISLTLSDYSAR